MRKIQLLFAAGIILLLTQCRKTKSEEKKLNCPCFNLADPMIKDDCPCPNERNTRSFGKGFSVDAIFKKYRQKHHIPDSVPLSNIDVGLRIW